MAPSRHSGRRANEWATTSSDLSLSVLCQEVHEWNDDIAYLSNTGLCAGIYALGNCNMFMYETTNVHVLTPKRTMTGTLE